MADLDDLLADLNDRIDDAANTQVPEATKIRYLNHGIRATWPKLYRTVADTSIALATDTFEYAIPAAVGDYAQIVRIDVETDNASGKYVELPDFEILPLQTSKILQIDYTPSYVGSRIRIVSAKRLTELVAGSDVYDGPPGTEELPVWYALGLVMDRRHENRLDYTRYTSVTGQNDVDANVIMNSSQFAFAQFELLLDRYAMPVPTRAG